MCCSQSHNNVKNTLRDQMSQASGEINKDDHQVLCEKTFCAKLQKNLWDIMENPDTNPAAKMVSIGGYILKSLLAFLTWSVLSQG